MLGWPTLCRKKLIKELKSIKVLEDEMLEDNQSMMKEGEYDDVQV